MPADAPRSRTHREFHCQGDPEALSPRRAMTRTSIEKAAKGLVVILFLIFVWYAFGVLGMMGLF